MGRQLPFMSGSLRMAPEADPLQKQMHRTPDKQKQQQRSCNMQASHDFVQAMYLAHLVDTWQKRLAGTPVNYYYYYHVVGA